MLLPLNRATNNKIKMAPPTTQTQGCVYQLLPPLFLLISTLISAPFSYAIEKRETKKNKTNIVNLAIVVLMIFMAKILELIV